MNILTLERKDQNSISTALDTELRVYVKENLADILLRGEKINEYISKEFKTKKKKRLYKGI